MFRGHKTKHTFEDELPISTDFKPRKKSSDSNIIYYVCVIGLLIFVWTVRKWAYSEEGGDYYSDQRRFSFGLKGDIDLKELEKFDKGVERYLIDHKGEVIEGSIEKEKLNEEIDMLYHSSVDYYDLNDFGGSPEGSLEGDHVLLLIPLRNAEDVLPLMFKHIMNLTYQHSLIDIAFLVSDCSKDDRTLETLFDYSVSLQHGNLSTILQKNEELEKDVKGTKDLYLNYMAPEYIERLNKAFNPPYHKDYNEPFRSVQIFKKDFGQVIGQGFSDRHDVKVQGIRRKLMGRARNWLTANALQPYHSWVYWRDVDIELMPGEIIQDLMKFNYDVMIPNVWRPLPVFLDSEQPYDLNSWMESDAALQLAETLDEDDVIVEGYAEYPTWRVHLAYIRDAKGNENEVLDLDGVGGVSILAKAKVFRQGAHFPAFTFLNHAETEAFGKMCKKMGFKVGGLPHYTIWHMYEPSEDDLQMIAKQERERRRQKKQDSA